MIAALLLVWSLALPAPDDPARVEEARAMAAATDTSLARGDYQTALVQAQKAFTLHARLGADGDAAWDLNAAGLANQYLGRYSASSSCPRPSRRETPSGARRRALPGMSC